MSILGVALSNIDSSKQWELKNYYVVVDIVISKQTLDNYRKTILKCDLLESNSYCGCINVFLLKSVRTGIVLSYIIIC